MLNQKVKMTRIKKRSNHKMFVGASVEKKKVTIIGAIYVKWRDPFYKMWMKLKNF